MDRWCGRLTPDELIKEFRDFKLKVINEDIVFNITNSSIRSLGNELDFIKDTFREEDIITGSIALRLFGLLHRGSNDIDILIKDKDRYSYIKDDYEWEIPNRLGYKSFNYRPNFFSKKIEYDVDFFEDLGCNFTEIEIDDLNLSKSCIFLEKKSIRVHNPIEILDFKMRMAIEAKSDKHNDDLTKIFVGIPERI
jgi:hypothetical protein